MLNTAKNIVTSLTILAGMLKIVQPVTELIEQFEKEDATGEQKKQAVLGAVRVLANSANSIFSKLDLPIDQIVTTVGDLIDEIVDWKNLVGAFTHKTTTAAIADTSTAAAQ